MRPILLAIVAAFTVLLPLVVVTAESRTTIDAEKFQSIVEETARVENFRHIEGIFPVKTIRRGGTPFQFNEALQDLDGITYTWADKTDDLRSFLDRTSTTALLVVKDDTLVYEKYFQGNTKDSLATSMSVAKSFTSALVGIALAEGHIKSIGDPITDYVPALKDSGYRGVPIEDLLQMSSGIDFSEVYNDQSSDLSLMLDQLAGGASVKEYAAGLGSLRKSGEVFYYASIDTSILGFLIENTTGMNPARYLEEKVWKKIGMESDATWATDNHGNVLTFGLLNATARDYAKFGRLYLNRGAWNGEQIVPEEWVKKSVKPGKKYLKLKDHYAKGWDIGYQYQWWVPEGSDGEFTGIGIWGQYLYVNPAQNLIIVKNSADPLFDTRDQETIAVFRAIGKYTSK